MASLAVVGGACASSPTSSHGAATTSTTVASTSSTGSSASPSAASSASCGPATTVAGSTGGTEVAPAGDIPDKQPFLDYASPDNVLVVSVPEGWARSEVAGAASFSDKLNTIKITWGAAPAAPTVETARATLVPELQRTEPCFTVTDVVIAKRKAGDAVLVTYHANSAPDPVTGKVVRKDVELYEFWKDGKQAVLTLSAPSGSDNVDPWRKVTDSFRWK